MQSLYKVGTCNDKYRLEKLLGQGAFGTVWKAYKSNDFMDAKPYALKFFNLEGAGDDDSVALELVDGTIGAYLYQSGCPVSDTIDAYKCTDADKINHDFMIVLEFIQEQTLDKFFKNIKTNHIKYAATLKLLQGFNCLHSHRVYHRDIKLENLMASLTASEFDVKIIDFGVSCAKYAPGYKQFVQAKLEPNFVMAERVWDFSCSEGPVGTVYYMPPEEFMPPMRKKLNEEKLMSLKDSYALGCVLWEIWENDGYSMYDWGTNKDEVLDILSARMNSNTPHAPNITPGKAPEIVIDLVRRLTMYDVNKRITISHALAEFKKADHMSKVFLFKNRGINLASVTASSGGHASRSESSGSRSYYDKQGRRIPTPPSSRAPSPPSRSSASRSGSRSVSRSSSRSWDSYTSGSLPSSFSGGSERSGRSYSVSNSQLVTREAPMDFSKFTFRF